MEPETATTVAAPAEAQPAPDTWAHVELMGHVSHWGRLFEEEKFGGKLGRVDIPRPDGGFTTVFFGGGSVYRITVVTEAVARHMAPKSGTAPVGPWDFPRQLPAPAAVTAGDDGPQPWEPDDEDDDQDDDQDDGDRPF